MSMHQIYSIILIENQVFTPDLLVGKLSDLLKAKLQYSTEKIDNKIITMHCNEIDAETYSSEDIKEQKKGSGEYWKIV
ncbi:MAG: hypothetical protein U0N42_11975 [Roseburia intestinalis]